MARPIEIDPDTGDADSGTPGSGSPSDPGYVPPTSPGTAIAFTVTGTNTTVTSTQIQAAGGPWASFTVRVTPLNANGPGTPATYNSNSSIMTETDRRLATEDGSGNIIVE